MFFVPLEYKKSMHACILTYVDVLGIFYGHEARALMEILAMSPLYNFLCILLYVF